jgi:hypothetical protein
MSEDLCPYCLSSMTEPTKGDGKKCLACGQLFVWSPKTYFEIQGREAIRDLRKLREQTKP